jgi:radical SAM protein with 4Fe4S-binding SPASM domain
MRTRTFDHFYDCLRSKTRYLPHEIQFELTYRCNLRCGHCYCQCLGSQTIELSTPQIKKILDDLRREGGFWLSFTGGEPLLRKDFLEIYAHAKKKGFLVTIFSNGLLWTDALIRALKKSPPYSVEITVNGITPNTYEAITGVPGSFALIQEKMGLLFKSGLPVVVKSNLMKLNQAEVPRIKQWVERHAGKPHRRHFFKYDYFLYPRLNGDKAPLAGRLSFDEIKAVVSKNADMRRQLDEELGGSFPLLERSADHLYQCTSWQDHLFINPAGQARFCLFSNNFSFDALRYPAREAMLKVFAAVAQKRFKTRSRCRTCRLRAICNWCPAKAKLETGSEEGRVEHYCRLTNRIARLTQKKRREHAGIS